LLIYLRFHKKNLLHAERIYKRNTNIIYGFTAAKGLKYSTDSLNPKSGNQLGRLYIKKTASKIALDAVLILNKKTFI
jgi:hypothetical protein